MALRWGLVGASKACHDFAIALLSSGDELHEVIAIAARHESKAHDLAKFHCIPRYYGDYLLLAKDTSVEAVYIGIITPCHYEICMMMLTHGKHVLCKTPMCLNTSQLNKLIAFAKLKKLFIMEALWSRFFPAYNHIMKQIKDGNIGEIQEVFINHGIVDTDYGRAINKDLGTGATLDKGVYAIQLIQFLLKDHPISIEATGKLNDDGVDTEMNCTLLFETHSSERKRKAHISISSTQELSNNAIIIGTKSQITVNHYWCPTTIIDVDGKIKSWELPPPKNEPFYMNSVGLCYQANRVRECIRNGHLECPEASYHDSFMIATILDEIHRQLAIKY